MAVERFVKRPLAQQMIEEEKAVQRHPDQQMIEEYLIVQDGSNESSSF